MQIVFWGAVPQGRLGTHFVVIFSPLIGLCLGRIVLGHPFPARAQLHVRKLGGNFSRKFSETIKFFFYLASDGSIGNAVLIQL